MGAAVVAVSDAPPVLDPSEDIFDPVPLFVEGLVVMARDLAIRARRDAGGDVSFGQSSAKPVAVITLVAEQLPGIGLR